MAQQPPPETPEPHEPEPSRPGQPEQVPPETPPTGPDIDQPHPGTSPAPPGPTAPVA